jgi:calcium-dependent protein kinase
LISHPGKIFAIKEICKEKVKNDIHLLKMELDILRSLDHPNIIKFYEAYQDPKNFYLSMEYCCGGELMQRLLQDGNLVESEVKRLMKQIFSSIFHLHSKGIVHRDLKPDNFLFDTKKPITRELKLIDFGLSKHYDPDSQLKSVIEPLITWLLRS